VHQGQTIWRRVVIRYLSFIGVANLAWETAQLPLYTIWQTGSPGELAFAVVHCTAGDVLIAAAALMLAMALVGRDTWPTEAYVQVAVVATTIGVGYTLYSEWLNTAVRQSWAYAPAMPTLPLIRTGLVPVVQWLVLPPLGFWVVRRRFGLRDSGTQPR
jgi:hypothetical protein